MIFTPRNSYVIEERTYEFVFKGIDRPIIPQASIRRLQALKRSPAK